MVFVYSIVLVIDQHGGKVHAMEACRRSKVIEPLTNLTS